MRLSKRGKRRLILLLSVVMLIVLGYVAMLFLRSDQDEQQLAEFRAAGMEAYEAGRYAEALEPLSRYNGRIRDDVETLYAFGDARARVPMPGGRHLAEAITYFNLVDRLDPDHFGALEQLVEVNMRVGRRAEARGAAQRVLEIEPDHINALMAMSTVLFAERQHDESMEFTDRLIELEPDNIDWRRFRLLTMLAADRSALDVTALAEAWVEQNPESDGRFRLVHAEILSQTGQVEAAQRVIEQAAEVGATDAAVLRGMINLMDNVDMRERASELVNVAKSAFPGESWVYNEAVRRYWQVRNHVQAFAELDDAEENLGGLDHTLLRWKVLLHILTNEHGLAAETLEQLERRVEQLPVEELDTARAWTRALEARIEIDSANWSAARTAFEEALTLEGNDPVLHYMLGESYQQIGEHELSMRAFRNAWRNDPNWIAAGLSYATTLLQLGRFEEALMVAASVADRSPSNQLAPQLMYARTWLSLARSRGDLSAMARTTGTDISRVIEVLEVLAGTEELRTSTELQTLRFQAYELAGEAERAMALVREIVDMADASGGLLLRAAATAQSLGMPEVDALLARAEAEGGATAETIEARALVMAQNGDLPAARALYDRAIADTRAGSELREQLLIARAMLLSTAGNEDAIAALHEALDVSDRVDLPSLVLAQGIAWRDESLIEKAIDRLRELVGEGGSARLRLAEAHLRLRFRADEDREYAMALGLLRDVLQETPDSLPALSLMADALLEGQNPDPTQAMEYLRQAIQYHPTRLELYPRLISMLQERGRFDEASTYLQRLTQQRQNDPAGRLQQLRLLEQQGDFDTAIMQLSSLSPDEMTASEQLILASLHMRAGNLSLADQTLQQLLAEPEPNPLAIRLAAELRAATGRLDEAVDLLQTRLPDDGRGTREIFLGALYRQVGMLDESIDILRRGIERVPDRADLHAELALTLITAGDNERARPSARRAVELEPNHDTGLRAVALSSIDAEPRVREAAFAALRAQGGDAAAFVDALALFQRITERGEDAPISNADLQAARRITETSPTLLNGWRLSVDLHARAGQQDRALQLAQQAVQRVPTSPLPPRWAAELLVGLNRPNEALSQAELWRQRQRGAPYEPDLLIASLHFDLGRPGAAARQLQPHFERIVAEAEEQPTRLLLAVEALVDDGRWERAFALVEPILHRDPEWLGRWINVATRRGSTVGEEMLTRVESFMVEPEDRILMFAGAWLELAQRSGSAAHINRAEQLALGLVDHPQLRVGSMLLRASVGELRDDYAAAEALYREALAVQPDNPVALNNLAYTLTRLNRNFEEAEGLARRAIEQYPEIPEFLDTHAVTLLGAGRLDEALQQIDRALAIRPDSPTFRFTRARILAAQERWSDAATAIERVRSMTQGTGAQHDSLRQRLEALSREVEAARDGGT